jgi:hypothetical protein
MSFTPAGIQIHSYYALLKATADALETNGSIGSRKPQPVNGELVWGAESSQFADSSASNSP